MKAAHADKVSMKEKETKTFSTVDEFNLWKEKEEESTFSYFVAKKGQAVSRIKHFYCQHDGSGKLHSQRTGGKPNSKGRVKVGHYCIAKMKTWIDDSNQVQVEYYPTHNHRLSKEDFVHHPLPNAMDRYITKKIAEGLPPEFIYEKVREKFIPINTDLDVSSIKANMITKKRILDRARRKRMARRLHQDDAKAVFLKASQMIASDDDSILLYKPYKGKVVHGPPEIDNLPNSKELFMLGIQTERQCELMKKHAAKAFIIDDTHSTNQYKYRLLTCMVVDENRRGWPVAHLISSRLDAPTIKYFFQALEQRAGGDTTISCVMTDGDLALFKKRDRLTKQLRHLLCKWHVLKNWKENLRSKASKDLFDTMNTELRLIMNCLDQAEFKKLCDCFLNKYENNPKASEFIEYFKENYLATESYPPQKWAMCYRNFPHAQVDTTGHLESFHNRLKKFYLKRKVNKRLDDLIDILLVVEWHDHCTRQREANTGFSALPQHIRQRHALASCMDDTCILEQELDNTWEIKSFTAPSKRSYVVVRYSTSCGFDHCFSKCSKPECHGLCPHLYSCSCPDNHPMCKHIHKLHTFLTRGEPCAAVQEEFYTLPHHKASDELVIEDLESNEINECTESGESSHHRKYETTLLRLQSHIDILVKFQSAASKKCIPEHSLIHVEAVIGDLVGSLEDLELNDDIDEQLEGVTQMLPAEKFAPNQKLKTQISQLAPFHRPKKRKQTDDPGVVAAKKRTILENLLQSAPISCTSLDETDCMTNDSFTVPRSYVEDPWDMVLELDNQKISLNHLKSLEQNISPSENTLYQNRDPLFIPGSLYSAIVDAFILKLSQNYEGVGALSTVHANRASENLSILDSLTDIDATDSKNVVLMPANLFDESWSIAAVMVKEGVIKYYDPQHRPIEGASARMLAQWVRDLKCIFSHVSKWLIKLIQLPKLLGSHNSGPEICHFAKQTLESTPYSLILSQADFRKVIYKTIVGNCLKRSNYFEELCGVCAVRYDTDSTDDKTWICCSSCHQWFHEDCVDSSSSNGLGLFVCP